MMDVSYLFPREIHSDLVWLGRIPDWALVTPIETVDVPRTRIDINWGKLAAAPGSDRRGYLLTLLKSLADKGDMLHLMYFEAGGVLLADGPKIFQPTDEQFESMEHVELRLPPRDFRSPYPAIVIQVPIQIRKRLAAEFNLPLERVACQVLVRHKIQSEYAWVLVCVRMSDKMVEEHFMFSDQPGNPDIETVINRRVVGNALVDTESLPQEEQTDRQLATVIARAAMNLCMMLTHFGCHTGQPLNPTEYARHRGPKRLDHLKHGDYITVNMKQKIIIRAPQPVGINPPGPGTGIEIKPHWRKGHWRAYPGHGAARAAGQQVPLLFVRPCLVRPDRASGDLSQSEVVYQG